MDALGFPEGLRREQTHPSVHPRQGHRDTRFNLRLRARDAIGVSGVVQTDYRVAIVGPRSACGDSVQITSAEVGELVKRVLAPPTGDVPIVGEMRIRA